MSDPQNILIIKHGALGDVVLATGPFAAIRATYPDASITLLTTPLYGTLLADAPYFDTIVIDPKPKPFDFKGITKLRHILNQHPYDWVFDLQTSSRTPYYYHLFKSPKPQWSGITRYGVWGISHPQPHGAREQMHTIDRHKDQLEIAGIADVPAPDVSWLKADISEFEIATPYALFVPGGSAHRPEKRWPEKKFVELAQWCIEQNIAPVILGAGAEETLCNAIAEKSGAVNLCNQTNFAQIAELAHNAAFAVGNDTGPIHLIAASECKTIVLFNTNASNPDLCAPRGEHVHIIAKNDLNMASLYDVTASVA